ncbi:MAG: TRAP transporter small permease [Spirochaetes bacterium]|nr:TRAP transporter small permease [Spirochaetota bacterium]
MKERPIYSILLRALLDFVEIWIPVITFAFMFLVFVIAIFFRYVLNHPLTWPYELSIILFIWTILFGAGYAKREDSHVVFSVIYDRLSPAKQRVSRIVAELIVLTAFIIGFQASTSYILFWKTLKTPALRISFDLVFFPYVVFMLLMIGRSAYNLFLDLRSILRKGVQE